MSCCKKLFTICKPLSACADILNIVTPIISDIVTLVFTDKFNNNYSVTKTSDSNGFIEIELVGPDNDLPLVLLNEFAGPFRFSAYDSSNNLVQYTINGLQYDALGFKIEKFYPIQAEITIDVYSNNYTFADYVESDYVE